VDWDPVFCVTDGKSNCNRTVLSNDRGIMAGEMLQKPTRGRLVTALRLAFYPAFESAEARRFQALTMEAENARGSGNLAKAEMLEYGEADRRSDPDLLHGFPTPFQRGVQPRCTSAGQRRISPTTWRLNTRIHALETIQFSPFLPAPLCNVPPLPRTCPRPDRAVQGSCQEFAKLYEAWGKYEAAEVLYRRAAEVCEQVCGVKSLFAARALDDLAQLCRARGRHAEAEELCRRSLAIVEENVRSQAAGWSKAWRPWQSRKELEAKIRPNQIPISSALDRLAVVCEEQQKYAEAEPLRRRSLEIKERAWGERYSSFLADSLAALANVLHKIGREDEAVELDKRVEAIRLRYPQGSIRCSLRATVRPIKRSLRWRVSTFVSLILHPSRFQSNSR